MPDHSNDPHVLSVRDEALALLAFMCPSDERDAARAKVFEEVARVSPYVESPIELMFLWRFTAWSHAWSFGSIGDGALLKLEPQVWFDDQEFGHYRMDFEIRLRGRALMVAVELDGHEFHERTPEQVEKRNARDNRLQLHGWRVLRFSGRQIHRQAGPCASTAWLTAYQRAYRWGLLETR